MTRRPFTVLEVLVAVGILALALGAGLGLAAQAKARLLRAETRRTEEQALANAAEYFLLTAPGGSPCPQLLLPEGWQAQCQVSLASDPGLPKTVRQGWLLGEYRIVVRDQRARPRGELRVNKLVREDDL